MVDSLGFRVLPPVLSEPGLKSSLADGGGGYGSFRDPEHTISAGSPGYEPVDDTQTSSWCTSALNDEIKAAVADMMDAVTDHEFYCATYASMEGPHIQGLLLTLFQSVQDRERYLTDLRCSRDVVYVYSSSSQMCHAICESSFCKFKPCAFCLSLQLVTHENSNLCVQQQANTGCYACGHLSCWATSSSCAATSG